MRTKFISVEPSIHLTRLHFIHCLSAHWRYGRRAAAHNCIKDNGVALNVLSVEVVSYPTSPPSLWFSADVKIVSCQRIHMTRLHDEEWSVKFFFTLDLPGVGRASWIVSVFNGTDSVSSYDNKLVYTLTLSRDFK